jgi:outer membrane protein TolC
MRAKILVKFQQLFASLLLLVGMTILLPTACAVEGPAFGDLLRLAVQNGEIKPIITRSIEISRLLAEPPLPLKDLIGINVTGRLLTNVMGDPDVEGLQIDIDKALSTISKKENSYLPTITLNYDYTRTDVQSSPFVARDYGTTTGTTKASLRQLLFDFKQTSYAVKSSSETLRGVCYKTEFEIKKLLAEIIADHYELQRMEVLLSWKNSILLWLNKYSTHLDDELRLGRISPIEKIKRKNEVESFLIDKEELEERTKQTRQKLKNRGFDGRTTYKLLRIDMVKQEIDDLLSSDANKHPLIIQAEANISSTAAALESDRRSKYPRVYFELSKKELNYLSPEGGGGESTASLVVAYDIFNADGVTRERDAEIQLVESQIYLEKVNRDLVSTIDGARDRLTRIKNTLEIQKRRSESKFKTLLANVVLADQKDATQQNILASIVEFDKAFSAFISSEYQASALALTAITSIRPDIFPRIGLTGCNN